MGPRCPAAGRSALAGRPGTTGGPVLAGDSRLSVAWWTFGPLPVVTFTTGTSTVSAALSKNIHYALSWSLFHSNYYRASKTNTSSKGNLCPCLSSHRQLSPNTKNWRYIYTCSNEHIVLLNLKHGGRGDHMPPHLYLYCMKIFFVGY
jgi:hypothetical protein